MVSTNLVLQLNNFSIFCVDYFLQEGYLQTFSLDYISRIRAGSKRRCQVRRFQVRRFQVPGPSFQVPGASCICQHSGVRCQGSGSYKNVLEFRDQVLRQNVKNFHIKNILRLNWNYKLILQRKLQTYKHVLHHAKSFFPMLSLRFLKIKKRNTAIYNVLSVIFLDFRPQVPKS